jgi:hypothetical protein
MGGSDSTVARGIVESLRYGIPPAGHVREFTVGRREQLALLEETLARAGDGRGAALLVKANYGGGKSHLLRIIRERALEAGYAVSLVVTDARNGTRFNRMDTIFGAVTRSLEAPSSSVTGLRALFDAFRGAYEERGQSEPLMRVLSARGTWAQNEQLSDPVLIGLRAWVLGRESQRSVVEEWFAWPQPYQNRRKDLYYELVADVEHRFNDRRSEAQYYYQNALAFHNDGHRNAWDGLGDLHAIAVASGFRGLVLLFDEFEDVIQNLNNRLYQVAAFRNLFDFFSGDAYPGMAYFAVTPDFARACREELLGRGVYDFPVREFARLPSFELQPIDEADFTVLGTRIAEIHGIAYGWNPGRLTNERSWRSLVKEAWGSPAPDRIRQAIQRLVQYLDAASRRSESA